MAGGLPTIEVPRADLAAGIGVLTAFVQAGLVKSNGEARRQIQGGGLKVNDKLVSDEKAQIGVGDLLTEGAVKLSLGKKKHVLLKPV
jgi:tyrosyl-tRNA synthetase